LADDGVPAHVLPDPIARRTEPASALAEQFQAATPVKHIVLDDFLDPSYADEIFAELPAVDAMPKSRDYVFSDKRELSTLDTHSPVTRRLHEAFVSDQFAVLLSELVGRAVFIDTEYVGGGFHAGATGSFLDLHTDFNIHPVHQTWRRELNILLYLNPGWEPSWGGELQLTDDPSRAGVTVSPLWNRLVVMESTATSYHGYEKITFPAGVARRSIAAYAYSLIDAGSLERRTTTWSPKDGGVAKRVLARNWNRLVLTKNRFLGSGTLKNRR
jgi:Rps23 Pro-64 3,4-dihydroxylase Tpa1-like proline 4-hydroxylase